MLREESRRASRLAKLAGATGVELWRRLLVGSFGIGFAQVRTGVEGDTHGDLVVGGRFATTADGGAIIDNAVVAKLAGGDGESFFGVQCGSTVCTGCDVCLAPDVCGVGIDPSCREPDDTGSKLLITHDPIGSKHRIKWKWSAGPETTPAELGDMRIANSAVLCLYDDVAGAPTLVWERHVSALEACGARACWKGGGPSTRPSFKFKETTEEPGGKTKVIAKLATGPGKKTGSLVKAAGPGATPPTLPLTGPVRAELRTSAGGLCWAAQYDAGILLNDPARFKAKSGP